MIKHLDIKVEGKVQGVGYRVAAKAAADQLGVKGTVKNEKDGSVSIEAEAEPMILDLFLDFCREGAETAHVSVLHTQEGEVKNYRNFEVLKRGLF